MIAIVTLLVAFPAGYLVRSLLAANVTYLAAYSWAFTFQGLYLLRAWVGGDHSAFPRDPEALPLAYGLVSLGVLAVGLALVLGGHRLARRRGRPAGARGVKAGAA